MAASEHRTKANAGTSKRVGRRKRADLPNFGDYVRRLREEIAKTGTQESAAKKLGLSQSVLAKIENGKVTDPHPGFLKDLAKLCRRPHFEVVLRLVKEKYGREHSVGDDEWPEAEDKQAWELIEFIVREAGPDQQRQVPLTDVLRSRLRELELGDVLDVPALARWQRKENFHKATYKELVEFWVAAPIWLGARERDIFEAVVHNLKGSNHVSYTYFIYDNASVISKFRKYQERLTEAVGSSDYPLKVRALPDVNDVQSRFAEQFFGTECVIANPNSSEGKIAFQGIRQGGRPVLFLELDAGDTGVLYEALNLTDELQDAQASRSRAARNASESQGNTSNRRSSRPEKG